MEQNIERLIELQDIDQLKTLYKNMPSLFFETNEQGENVLHLSSKKQNQKTPQIINFLLDIGVDPLAVTEAFKDALEIAKENKNVWALSRFNLFLDQKNRAENKLQDST